MIPQIPTDETVELHVRTTKSSAAISVDDKTTLVNCETDCVNVIRIQNANSVYVQNTGLGYVSVSVKDYKNKTSNNFGIIKWYLKIK